MENDAHSATWYNLVVRALPEEKRTIRRLVVLVAQHQFGRMHTKSEYTSSVDLPPSDRVKRVHPNGVLVFQPVEKRRGNVARIAAHS